MYDLVIIGAGPAGLTAGIYAGRAGLNTIILDAGQSGGTVNTAPLIENYPGIDKISGTGLMKSMTEQTRQYVEIKEFTKVESIDSSSANSFEVKTNNGNINTRYIILATGTQYKTLAVEGVDEFSGRGVSYCAVCDGTFFIDQEVIVVGGGNSAATEALYLNRIGVKCSIVHRRDKLRCDAKLVSDIKDAGIKIYWNSELKSVKGNGRVEEAIIYNNKTNNETCIKVNGVFIAIGYNPNNSLAKKINIKCDDSGYIYTDKNMKTSINGIYAAGNVTGGVKQIIVSAGQGAQAATEIQNLLL
ncbi:NAD(P)/FAD-dependent oxidoreductase [Methanosphaera sp. WGK6]|uniref:NAD(P)/FAD-dependent oxidoreductase n=1 Tax=Methanosphaera sp. WGK6 TaxID=1561964 RepID=UPI00084C4CBC|nr:FAD-dependent oxidoreductase [Methanosphaera sp. WGK6]OED29954.1 thioredoxin reductase [Methanosphaera sp. WGK6]